MAYADTEQRYIPTIEPSESSYPSALEALDAYAKVVLEYAHGIPTFEKEVQLMRAADFCRVTLNRISKRLSEAEKAQLVELRAAHQGLTMLRTGKLVSI